MAANGSRWRRTPVKQALRNERDTMLTGVRVRDVELMEEGSREATMQWDHPRFPLLGVWASQRRWSS